MTQQTETFKLVKTNRIIKNKNNAWSVSLRLYNITLKTFCNGSLYIPNDKDHYLQFIRSLTQGALLSITYKPSANPQYKGNLDIKHIDLLQPDE